MPKLKSNIIHFDDKEQLLSSEMEPNKSCDISNDKTYIPDSILKQSTSKSKNYKTTSSSSGLKPNIIMSLEDRDIVVIDQADYKESIGNESEVIVVEKPRIPPNDIDLADLLGSNWPSIAGDSALALNNRTGTGGHYNISSGSTSSTSSSNYQLSSSSAQNVTHTERNKSKNPLSHFGQSKIKRSTANLIHLDSNGSGSSNESSTSSEY